MYLTRIENRQKGGVVQIAIHITYTSTMMLNNIIPYIHYLFIFHIFHILVSYKLQEVFVFFIVPIFGKLHGNQ